jgi:nanoRNase/pAp phosphatase (c-di-AMP/oligoRNAs hydrolase)
MPSPDKSSETVVPSEPPGATPSTLVLEDSSSDFDLMPALAGLRDHKSVLIFMHDNPDPDALASAFGLKRLIEHGLGIHAALALGGIVGRAENRAMVETLGIPLLRLEALDISSFDTLAIVDSQPATGNNSLPAGRTVDIVVDHHPARAESASASWCDIRAELGATSTIIVEYLRTLNVPLDTPLATALFYALRAETRDLGREATHSERQAYLFLFPLVDFHLLSLITRPKVPREHFAALDRALRSAQVWGGDLVTVNMGEIAYPDLVAEVADLLLAGEGTRFVLCSGLYGGHVYLSLRTEPSESRAGTLMRQLIGHDGAAGGHGTMAGARLYAPPGPPVEQRATFNRLIQRFFQLLDRKQPAPVPLIG